MVVVRFGRERVLSPMFTCRRRGAAKDVAVAELNRLARNFLRGRAVVDGNGKLFAGVSIKFTGHRDGFNPEAYVISARHLYESNRGFSTEVRFCSNTFPE